MEQLDIDDIELILESLRYTKMSFENYQFYPSHEIRAAQIRRVDKIMEKIREYKNANIRISRSG